MAEMTNGSARIFRMTGTTMAMCVVAATCMACGNRDSSKAMAIDGSPPRPDSNPVMLNKDMPFRYPPALYAEKVQGNVMLRLFVNADGSVAEDSTRVVESSKYSALDSAAIKGSRELKFVPAKLHGTAVPVSILFPVYFRHPEAPPPASDTAFNKVPLTKADSAAKKDTATAKKADTPAKSSSAKSAPTTKSRHKK